MKYLFVFAAAARKHRIAGEINQRVTFFDMVAGLMNNVSDDGWRSAGHAGNSLF